MPGYFSLFSKEKWEELRTSPYFEEERRSLSEQADLFLSTPPAYLKFSDLHLFATTGNRTVYEKTYTDHLSRMENYFIMFQLTEDEKYLTALIDIIWDICGVESWSIPAHVKEFLTIEQRRRNLDLVSTDVGRKLSQIYRCIGDRFPDLVQRRIEHEIRERILDPYMQGTQDDYWWMKTNNNWAAVCAANVFCTFMLMASREETDSVLPRLEETIGCFLVGFDDEGCCKEGYAYWKYGFGHFCIYAAAIREYTNGERDYFKLPKIRAIAGFEESIAINDSQCISFSDCGQNFAPIAGLSHFLKDEYPDLCLPVIPHPSDKVGTMPYLLWVNPAYENLSSPAKAKTFRENQWFIYRSEAFNFACKAGCNNEFHNHNDVGSFVFSKDGKMTFTDPGPGEYTRQYFSATRYDILGASSRGHSVPIINGQYQVTGQERSTILTEADNAYVFTMKNAYDIPTLSSLTRSFRAEKDELVIADTYSFTECPSEIVERFVSFLPIEIKDGIASCGTSELVFDSDVLEASVTAEDFRVGLPLYQLNLNVKKPAPDMTISVQIR